MNAKKEKLAGIVGYLEEECKEYQTKLSTMRAELLKVESELVGRREKLLYAREALRRHSLSLPNREVTCREHEIARMLNIHLEKGEPLSEGTWEWVCSHRSK